MRNRQGITAVVITALIVAPAAYAGENNVRYTRSNQSAPKEPGRHAMLGLVTGGLAGTILGLYAAARLTDASDGGAEMGIGLWAGFAVAGAVVGYAAGGGFSDGADQALDLGRERVRQAELAAQASAPLPELRMSAIAGFGQLAVAAPETALPLQLAAFR